MSSLSSSPRTPGEKKPVSWHMLGEGAAYGFLSMLVAEKPVFQWAMPVSWIFFLAYLVCRHLMFSFAKTAERLASASDKSRMVAWILMVGATLISAVGQ